MGTDHAPTAQSPIITRNQQLHQAEARDRVLEAIRHAEATEAVTSSRMWPMRKQQFTSRNTRLQTLRDSGKKFAWLSILRFAIKNFCGGSKCSDQPGTRLVISQKSG
jgi:hypothetical protein